MKKFTLLAVAAIAAGTQVGYADELPGGIKTSTRENPVYYTIKNMRADRLNYVNGEIWDAKHEEVVAQDNSFDTRIGLPEYLPDGSDTPMIWESPYMGLAQCENKFWTAFSAMDTVMNPNTIYWFFEKASRANQVYIANAVIDGYLKSKAENVLGRPSMSFTSAKNGYYVIPLTDEQIEELELEDDEYGKNAFALSTDSSLTDKNDDPVSGQCLDVNNYITYNFEVDSEEDFEDVVVGQDEDGEDIVESRPVKLRYGFAGVNKTWNPLSQSRDGNENHRINNGSLFQVEEVTDVEKVNKAIEAYKQVVIDAYRAQVKDILDSEKESVLSRIETLKNLPALYNDAAKLEAIAASVNSFTVNTEDVKTQEDVDVLEAKIQEDMQAQYLRAMALAGDGTVITLQQMFALRDWTILEDDDAVEDFQLGNAYLSSIGAGLVKDKGGNYMAEAGYDAVTCVLEKDASCEWTMEWVPGQGYRLKNNGKYIRQFGNWTGLEEMIAEEVFGGLEDLEEDQTIFDLLDTNQMSWALTEDASLAAVFTFSASAEAVQEVTLSETELENYEFYGELLGYDPDDTETLFTTTNIAHLTAPDPEGNVATMVRDTAAQDYIVSCWNGAGNRYFANANCWKIETVKAGEEIPDGIEELTVSPKTVGIYDLQGRKVAKAGKGLYIVNGVKTLVK